MLIGLNEIFAGTVAIDGSRAGQAITATTISTNVIDTRIPGNPALVDQGLMGDDVWVVVQVLQGFNNLTSLTVTLESDSAASLAVAPLVHFAKTTALTGLAAGATPVRIALPCEDYKRYLGLRFAVNGTAPTQGSLYAYLTNSLQRNVGFASGFTMDA